MGEGNEIIFDHTPESPYINWIFIRDQFSIIESSDKRARLSINMQDYFETIGYESRDITGVQNLEEENYIIIAVGETLYYFDIYSEQFCGNTLAEANEFRAENPSEEVGIIVSGIPVLQEVMLRNNDQGYFGSFLNENDRVDFESQDIFAGLTAEELQILLRENIEIFETRGGLLGIDQTQREQILPLYRTYMEIVMGIGDRYEQGSHFFLKTEAEIDLYMRTTVYSFGDFDACLDYYSYISEEITNNYRWSKTNREAYTLFTQKLGVLIFERLQRELDESHENPEQEQMLLSESLIFIEMLRGREQDHTEIHRDMRNPLLAEEVCIFLISRQGGILDTLENCTRYNLDFSDPVVGDRTPSEVITQVEERLGNIGFENPRYFLRVNFGIQTDMIVGTENNSYENLSLSHKRNISLLARLIEKIDAGELSPEILQGMNEEETQEYIMDLGNEITQEAFDAVRKAYDRNFEDAIYGGRPIYIAPDFISILQDIGVGDTEIEALRLFHDIRGHDSLGGFDGVMNFSDESLNTVGSLGRSAGIIIGTIAIVMIATYTTGGLAIPALASMGIGNALIASGGGLSVAGSLTSIGVGAILGTGANYILDPRTHDTLSEAIEDVGTDFAINTLHAIYMERLTIQLWHQVGNLGRGTLIGGDLGSGIGIEVARERMINEIFHSEPLFREQSEIGNISELGPMP